MASRGRIRSLEIENFKSFGGKNVIAFRGFTSVVGPNGAGKSNLMDAVSFVLGIHSRHLRSSKLIELLHKGPGASRGSRRATVALTYERPSADPIYSGHRSLRIAYAQWTSARSSPHPEWGRRLSSLACLFMIALASCSCGYVSRTKVFAT